MESLRLPRWAPYVAAGGIGIGGLGGCVQAAQDVAGEPAQHRPADDRIARGLDRLQDLEVFEVSELIDGQAEASGSPYVDGPLEIQTARLEEFATIAEQVTRDISADDIARDFQTSDGEPTLCVRGDEDFHCLTRSLHAENLAQLNELQIVAIDDIIRSDAEVTGFCYSSWETVTEDDCVRALKLQAIATAAKGEMQ